jgi:hypothetical protein
MVQVRGLSQCKVMPAVNRVAEVLRVALAQHWHSER